MNYSLYNNSSDINKQKEEDSFYLCHYLYLYDEYDGGNNDNANTFYYKLPG